MPEPEGQRSTGRGVSAEGEGQREGGAKGAGGERATADTKPALCHSATGKGRAHLLVLFYFKNKGFQLL